MRTLDFEKTYDQMFDADERPRNELVRIEAETPARWLDDTYHNRHKEDGYVYEKEPELISTPITTKGGLQQTLDSMKGQKMPDKTFFGTYRKFVKVPYSQHFNSMNNQQFKHIPDGM